MNIGIFSIQHLYFVLRILLAGLCGILIGIERRNRSKEAGIRTHFVVACGAALMMVVSKYAFFDVVKSGLINGADIRLDPSRVASTIASGIGFLGAGMIFVHKNTISGLTTAAGIWATSGVGMAIGSGMYIVGVSTTILILIGQYILHMNKINNKAVTAKILIVRDVIEDGFQKRIVNEFKKMRIAIQETTVESSGEANKYVFKIEVPENAIDEEIVAVVNQNCILKNAM